PGASVPSATLLDAAWPNDRSARRALENRLWVALSKMRRAGLDPVIERTSGGYRIPEHVRLVTSPDEPVD
ncbi:MAG: hypothetical protein AAGA48_38645, partial [Myxococcota bacterium]